MHTFRSLNTALSSSAPVLALSLSLDDDDDPLTGEMAKLTSLTTLSLDGLSDTTALPEALADIGSLKVLSLKGKDSETFSVPSFLSSMSLTSLTLSRCEVSSLPSMPTLRELQLEQVSDPAAAIEAAARAMPSLKILGIVGSAASAAAMPDAIGAFKDLEELSLRHCTFNAFSDELGTLNRLEKLSVTGTNDVDRLPDAVAKLTALESLTWSSEIEALPEALRALTSLKSLSLRALKLGNGTLPAVIRELPALESLDLSTCAITDLDGLQGLALTTLDLSSSQVADLSGLVGLKTLEDLNLRSCKHIKDWSPISQLKNLHTLVIKDCAGLKNLDFLKPLEKLRTLDIVNNKPAVIKGIFEPPLIDRLVFRRDPNDVDNEWTDEHVVQFCNLQTLRRLPSIDEIKARLERAADGSGTADVTTDQVLDQALRYVEATTTAERRALGIVFGDEAEPVIKKGGKKKKKSDDDDDGDDGDDVDGDGDDDDSASKKAKAKKSSSKKVAENAGSLPLLERVLEVASNDVSDKTLLTLFRLSFRTSDDRFPIAVQAARALAEREGTHEALGALLVSAFARAWKRRPRKGTPHDLLVDEVFPLLTADALAPLFERIGSHRFPEKKGDGLLRFFPRALATATSAQAQTLVSEIENMLGADRQAITQDALRDLLDEMQEAAGQHGAAIATLRSRFLGWYELDRVFQAAQNGGTDTASTVTKGKTKAKAPAATPVSSPVDALNALLLQIGNAGGHDVIVFKDHFMSLRALVEGNVPSHEAQAHVLRTIYLGVNGPNEIGAAAMKNLLRKGDLEVIRQALEPYSGRTRAQNHGVIKDLEQAAKDITEGSDKVDLGDDVMAFIDTIAGRTASEGKAHRATRALNDVINNFGCDDDDRAKFYALLAVIDTVEGFNNGRFLASETEALVGKDVNEAWRILDVLDKFPIDQQEREAVLAALSAGLPQASTAQRKQLVAMLPAIDDVVDEQLAFALARDAARRKDKQAMVSAAKKACELGKDESDFDDDFEAWARDPEFAAAIGRDPDKGPQASARRRR